jgi:hypothetical protein
MPAQREAILARVAALLVGVTPAGPNIYRAREVAITKAMTPAITVLFDGESTSRAMGQHALRHEMQLLLAIFVRGDPWDQLATAVDEAAHRALMADAPLRALLADLVRLSTDPEAEEADRTAGTLSVRYRLTFLTAANDIATSPA